MGNISLSFIRSLRWIGYACVPMACSASPKPIGTIGLMALFAYTLFAFAMALLALLAPPEFAAFAAFSFVRLIMHWHVRAFAYSATLFAFFYVPGTAPYPWGELCGRMMADAMGPGLCVCIGLCQAKPPSHATQPLNIRFGIGFMVALVLPLSNAQWLIL